MSDHRENKKDIAIALQYDGRNAPRVTAKGEHEVAEKIREIAREHDIPLHEDSVLALVLSQVELGEEIPPALYLAVAEVIAFAYLLSGKVCGIPTNEAGARPPAPARPR